MKKLIVGIVGLGCVLQAVALEDARKVPAAKDVDVLVVGGTVKGVVAALEAKAKGVEKVRLVTPFPYLGEDMAGTLELTPPAGMDLSSPLLRKMWSGKCGWAPFDYWPDHHTPHPRAVFKNDWWDRLSETSLPHSPTDAVYYEDDVGYRCVLKSDAAISAVEVTVLENEGARTAGVDGAVVAGTDAGTSLSFVRKDATVPIRGDGNYRDAAAVTWTAPVAGPLKEVKLTVRKAPAAKSQLVARIGFRLRDAEATFTPPSPLKVKQVLDRALVDAGVDFLTMTAVRRVMRDAAGKVVGVETVNRSGRTLYRARRIVDASRFGVLSADARYAEGAEAEFSRVVIADGPAPAATGMSVERLEGAFEISHTSPAVKGLAYRCRMKLPVSGWRYPALAAAEWEARDRTWVAGTLDDAGLLVPVRDGQTAAGEKAADGIPCWGEFDVVVVGGGTSGSPTAIAAARAGAKVLLVEYLDVLGGTGTDGMILGYYDGNHCGFTEEFKRANKEIGGRFGLYRRAETWRQMCRQAGVTVWLGAMGTGALVEDGRVRGVEVSTELGTGAVRAKCVVDSTGNADVAAAAGARTWFLPPGELALQSAGQAPHRLGRGGINSDFGYLVDSSAEDLWLFGVRARAGAPDAWDIAKMPDSRERRRIVPDFLLNAQDVAAQRGFPDTVVQPLSRQDSHGYLVDDFRFVSAPSAQLLQAGQEMRWKFSVNVPLRSLLPKGVRGLAVTGISTGCARDVLPIIRMQADLMNMGYGVGVAAAMAAKRDGDFRAIDCAALRRALVEKGILREEALAWEKDVDVSSDAVVAAAVRTMGKDLRGSDVVWRPENRARALPLLRTAYAAAGTAVERQNYALALGLLGDPTGVETLVGIVTGKVAIEPVDRKGAFGTGGNAGAPGSPETKAGFLLALGRTKAKEAARPILGRLEEIRPGLSLKSLRPVLLAAEALGDPAAAPILAKCLKMDGYHGFAVKSVKDLAPLGGYGLGPEMLECLKEIGFARTLWACGDCDGLARRTLEAYAQDPRGPLAAHAKAVLSTGAKERPLPSAVEKELSRPFAPFQAKNSSFVEIFEEVAAADRAADRAWRQLKSQAEYDAYRKEMKAKMIAAVGGFPEKTPLGAQVTKTFRRDGYTVEKVLFQSRPGVYVTGQFYRPDDVRFKPPFPAVVVSCGHAGKGMACDGYQRACVDLAKRGICGFIFDAMGQGERLQGGKLRNTEAHNAIGVPAMLLGGSMAQFRIWDGVRAIDYVTSRPDVDAARIGYEGQSGGGTMTSLMMAVDDRIRAAAPSCYLTNLRELADHIGPQDAEQNIFGQLAFGLNHLGFILMQDIPVMVVCKKQDMFSYYGTGETFDQLMEVAATLGKTDRYFLCSQPGPHGWIESTRAASALWMDRWLCGSKEPIDLPTLRLLDYGRDFDRDMREGREDGGLPAGDGYVTPNASVLELPGAKSIFTLMDEKLANVERTRKPLSADGKRDLVRSFAKVRTAAEANCRIVACGEAKLDGVTAKRFLVCHPKGLNLPAVLLTPAAAEGAPVLVVHPKGRGAAAAEVVSALAAKRPVLAIDCLGTGEVGGSKHPFYGATDTPEEGLAVMLYWLGDSLVARRATDLLVAADVCAKLTGAKPELVAFGTYAVPAAHAFAADRAAFAGVSLREPSKTWAEMVRSHVRERFETCVNGALRHYDWPELLKE